MTASPSISWYHTAFYKFVAVNDVGCTTALFEEITQGLLGSILVAPEGINGMVAGSASQLDGFCHALEADPRFDGVFTGIVHKRTACSAAPFARMKIRPKKEIVPLGLPDVDASARTGINLDPQAWREFIARDDVVVIDNRNSFEYKLGAFEGAIDPQVDNFRDFSAWFDARLPDWQAAGKSVAMYCTGGIRCEKTTSWLAGRGITAYQLEGGILNYFQALPDADKDFKGECFVFDRRVSLDTQLQETQTSLEDVARLDDTGHALWLPKKRD